MDQPRVFLSYRRQDAAYQADWLYEILSGAFGAERVFKDVDSILPGDDFAEEIRAAVESCDVLLVLIGDRWLTATDVAGHRRLDAANDFVRLEVESALRAGVRVVPVLVGTTMPAPDDLPVALRELARKQAWDLPTSGFAAEARRLVEVLGRVGRRPGAQVGRVASPPSRDRGELLQVVPGGAVVSLDVHDDLLATATTDGIVQVWDIRDGRELARLPHADGVGHVAFSPAGDLMATSAGDGLRVWKVEGWERVDQRLMRRSVVQGRPWAFAFLADGAHLLMLDPDEGPLLWRIGGLPERLPVEGRTRCAAVDPDGTAVAVVVEGPHPAVCVMSVPDPGLRRELDLAVDGSPALGWGGRGRLAVADGASGIQVWDTHAAQVVTRFRAPRISGGVRWLRMDATGDRVVAMTRFQLLGWDVSTGRVLCRISRGKLASDVALDPTGRFVAAVGRDDAVAVRRIDGGERVARLPYTGTVGLVRFLDDGVLATGEGGIARLWKV